jgi:hypothetical protein
MEDEFLAHSLVVYNEKEIAKDFTIELIMDEYYSMKDHCQPQFIGNAKFHLDFIFVHVYS